MYMPVLTAIKIKPLVTSSTLKFGILLACFLCFFGNNYADILMLYVSITAVTCVRNS